MSDKPLIIIGRAELLQFNKLGVFDVPARIDTGAKTSSLWASDVREQDGVLHYKLFGKTSEFYDGAIHQTVDYSKRLIASSSGHIEERYVVKHPVTLAGRTVHASFSLANRANQAYPVLVGRNILRGKFMVDVKRGDAQAQLERHRTKSIEATFNSQKTERKD